MNKSITKIVDFVDSLISQFDDTDSDFESSDDLCQCPIKPVQPAIQQPPTQPDQTNQNNVDNIYTKEKKHMTKKHKVVKKPAPKNTTPVNSPRNIIEQSVSNIPYVSTVSTISSVPYVKTIAPAVEQPTENNIKQKNLDNNINQEDTMSLNKTPNDSNPIRSSPLVVPQKPVIMVPALEEKADHNYDQIINNFVAINERLKILARLKGGYKIWVNADESFVMDDSYIPSFTRYIGGQSRKRIIERIAKDVDYISSYYKSLDQKARAVVQVNAKASLFGIYNLKNMYQDYSDELDKLANRISRAVN